MRHVDQTINDYLGNLYCEIDRVLEAKLQWSHARDLKPEPDELRRIDEKLKVGLADDKSNSAEADKARKQAGGGG